MDTKLPTKLKEMINSTLKQAFPDLVPLQVELLNKMFDTAFLHGIDKGIDITKGIVDTALESSKKK